MNAITYLKKNPLIKDVFGILLGLAGFYFFLFASLLIGLIFMGYSIRLLSRVGSQLDLTSKRYRDVYSLFGFAFGKWKPFPEFEYVSVFSTKEGTSVSIYGAGVAKIETQVIHLNLFYKSNKYITVYKTEEKNDAFKVAEHLKLALDIDILDATEKEKKWL